MILPIPLIAHLQLPLKRRIGAIILVSLGCIVCIAGAVRAYYSWLALIDTYDETWQSYGIYISATVEVDLGVICACAPALRVILVKIVAPRLSTFTKSLSEKSPFASRSATKRLPLGSSASTQLASDVHYSKGTFEMTTSSMSTYRPSTTDDLLREKGFILSSGHNQTKPLPPLIDTKEREGTPDPQYLWDEPWNGKNGPLGRRHSTGTDALSSARNSTPVSARYGVAIPVKLTRANTTASPHPLRHSQSATPIHVVEQPGVGILPDSSRASDASSETETMSIHSIPSSISSEGVDLPIQMTPKSPPATLDQSRTSVPRISSSSLKKGRAPAPLFDFQFDFEKDRPSTSGSTAGKSMQKTLRRISWLESQENLSATPLSPAHQYVKQQHSLLKDAILHDRIRALNRGKRGEDIDRDIDWPRPSSSRV